MMRSALPMVASSRSRRFSSLAFPKAHDRSRGGEEPDGDVASACPSADRDDRMDPAASHVPVEHEILGPVDEVERRQAVPAPVLGEAGHAPIVSIELPGPGEDRVFGRARTP